ncbi:hypothetical protein NVP1172O_58 [Vibrio phage 1.172.O._10N.261.52.F5]|nr:hypothetical protein NVP1116O_58 [Vibrio phage 1.116.O._10N.222.52.C10]AUR92473.1 hypothetical protein NVP1172O_58 [Vibrio phage 1.172.O._10N.261.52.F5]AUR97497.1 hypothetical protein NVP1239O_61 [Vibrio phage 1.239.O._10N.261.52.F6]
MNAIYIIRQAGVYWHNIIEVHADKDKAVDRCNILANSDADDYHEWVVSEHAIGTENSAPRDYWGDWPCDISEIEVYKTKKGAGK